MQEIRNCKKKTSKCIKRIATAAFLAGSLLLQGCGLNLNLRTESGSNAQLDLNRNDYLALDILESDDETLNPTSVYDTYELKYDTFQTSVSDQKVNIYVPIVYSVNAEFDSGEMYFQKFLVSRYSYVQAGDPIAEITMKTDAVTIKEAELSLERLKNQYQDAKDSYTEANEDRYDELEGLDENHQQLKHIGWYINDLKWLQTETNYLERIKSAEDNIKQLKENAARTTVVSNFTGLVMELGDFELGQELKKNEALLAIVPADGIYVSAIDANKTLSYGMDMTLSVRVNRTTNRTYDATIISPPSRATYLELNDGKAYLKFNDISAMADALYRGNIYMHGITKHIENVLLVPKQAVEAGENVCYTTVLKDDGSLVRTPFIAGGNNSEYYWVISGLEAGMKVIVN